MASGQTLCVFTALHGEPPASNAATPDLRNQHPVLDFDASTEKTVCFTGVMPRHYSGGGIDVLLHFSAAATITGAGVWGTAFERLAPGEQSMDTDGFAAEKTVAVNVPTTGTLTAVALVQHSGAEVGGVTGGDPFRVRVARKAADAADTASGDLELIAVELREA